MLNKLLRYNMRRSIIKKAKRESKKFFIEQKRLGNESIIYKSCRNVLRTNNFLIDYNNPLKCLDNIEFTYDSINKYWAETDGISIFINTYKNYTLELLTNTLIHEGLHYTIYRNLKHEIPEEKEHKIMELINPQLIKV